MWLVFPAPSVIEIEAAVGAVGQRPEGPVIIAGDPGQVVIHIGVRRVTGFAVMTRTRSPAAS